MLDLFSFSFTVFIFFLLLKLFHIVDNSWIVIFSPIWISFILTFLIVSFLYFQALIKQGSAKSK